MNLQHLCAAPHVTVYFDSWNNWLYVEWEGELTLPVVQQACLEIARCYLSHAYPRVLNDNTHVTSISWDVASWLATQFLPALDLAGVQQIAWVCATTVQGRDAALATQSLLPHMAIALFDDVEEAVAWLQHVRPPHSAGNLLPRPLQPGTKLDRAVQQLAQQLGHSPNASALAAPTALLPAQ